ncbi:MAG: outer membrane protein assembly factor BamD [Pseudomonadota bacterium]
MRLWVGIATVGVTCLVAGGGLAQTVTPPADDALDPVTEEAVLIDPETGLPVVAATPEPVTLTGPDGIPFTLEDLRRELTFIGEELDRLRRQVRPSGQPLSGETGTTVQGDVLTQINALEQRLQDANSRIDLLRFDLEQIARDGGTRLSDMDFRVTMLEQSDPSFVPPPAPLGDGTTDPDAQTETPFPASEIALAEQFAFDAALEALKSGEYTLAEEQFDAFLEVYPDGPLSEEASLRKIDAQYGMGSYSETAQAYLAYWNDAPASPLAPEALTGLGASFSRIGQPSAACATFSEVELRYAATITPELSSRVAEERRLSGC